MELLRRVDGAWVARLLAIFKLQAWVMLQISGQMRGGYRYIKETVRHRYGQLAWLVIWESVRD
jgi:hypothetical protein